MTDVALRDIADYLDEYLRIREIPDAPNAVNGLQVENRGRVTRIVAAVDASLATIEELLFSPSEFTATSSNFGLALKTKQSPPWVMV